MKILLVGVGGYGATYLRPLMAGQYPQTVIEGIVDPYFEKCAECERILEAGIPVYETMDAFYREHSAELAVISTPTFLHCQQSIFAVQNGSHVLCEKPAAPTKAQVMQMIEAEKQYGRFIAIGFQWSFSEAVLALKQDILDGKLGRPVLLRTMIQWPRGKTYYRRGGGWGGRLSLNGMPVYDSIASNACAHYLHNMLFVLGEDLHSSACPAHTEAECLRANPIENFDTCTIKLHLANGAEAFFVASHATASNRNPVFEYEFTKARVHFSADDGSQIVAVFDDGSTKNYGDPFYASGTKKLEDCMACVESGNSPVCTVSTAYPHAALIDELQQHLVISDFPPEMIFENEERIYAAGLTDVMNRAYEKAEMFSKVGYDFAKPFSF